jgi:hypothetical protein
MLRNDVDVGVDMGDIAAEASTMPGHRSVSESGTVDVI